MIARLAVTLLLGSTSLLFAQAVPTAERVADAQIGVGFTTAAPDYVHQRFPGFAIYGTLDPREHWGLEAEFHQVFSSNGDKSFQRTYAIGGRYFWTFGNVVPYAKGMYGRGDFQYPFGTTELGYNMFVGAGGIDLKLFPKLHARVEYEYQKWISFPNGGFHPQLVTFGVAYHVHGKPRYKDR